MSKKKKKFSYEVSDEDQLKLMLGETVYDETNEDSVTDGDIFNMLHCKHKKLHRDEFDSCVDAIRTSLLGQAQYDEEDDPDTAAYITNQPDLEYNPENILENVTTNNTFRNINVSFDKEYHILEITDGINDLSINIDSLTKFDNAINDDENVFDLLDKYTRDNVCSHLIPSLVLDKDYYLDMFGNKLPDNIYAYSDNNSIYAYNIADNSLDNFYDATEYAISNKCIVELFYTLNILAAICCIPNDKRMNVLKADSASYKQMVEREFDKTYKTNKDNISTRTICEISDVNNNDAAQLLKRVHNSIHGISETNDDSKSEVNPSSI